MPGTAGVECVLADVCMYEVTVWEGEWCSAVCMANISFVVVCGRVVWRMT